MHSILVYVVIGLDGVGGACLHFTPARLTDIKGPARSDPDISVRAQVLNTA